MMTNKEYVATLKYIASIPTFYKNKFPYNLGYYNSNGKYSFDCWNLIKSVINGWKDTKQVGYYVKGFYPTGDIDGATILKKCTKKGKDFSQLKYAGTYLYMSGHAGTYIGEVSMNGHTYNVIECTASWDAKVLYSWVDADGTRRKWKGGSASKKWTDWGLMCWITYEEDSKPAPAPTPTPQPTPAPSSSTPKGVYIYNKLDYAPVFNPEYYAMHNTDVVACPAFGSSSKGLWNHFVQYGMKEGRQACTNFNPKVYRSKNPDLNNAFGNKWELYYEHYIRYGYKENRITC